MKLLKSIYYLLILSVLVIIGLQLTSCANTCYKATGSEECSEAPLEEAIDTSGTAVAATGSCDFTSSQGICQDFLGSAYAGKESATCSAFSGSYNVKTCLTTNCVGSCDSIALNIDGSQVANGEMKTYFYTNGNPVYTAVSAKTACDSLKGTFSSTCN